MKNPWKQLDKRYVYEHYPFLKVRKDRVIQPDGEKGLYSVVERPDTVIIISKDKEDKLVLVRQWRYPIGRESLEFPMGQINKGESPKAAAIREYAEETGFAGSSWEKIGEFNPTSGLSENKAMVFLAKDLERAPKGKNLPREDPTEKIKPETLTLSEFKKLILKGEVTDAFTITALWYYENRRG